MKDVLLHYGFQTSRNGRIPCPLHNGKDNNFSYKERYFKCFVCGVGGSVIDFVMRLFGISFAQACLRINTDFGLGLTGERPSRAERTALLEARRREAERKAALDSLYRRVAAEHLRYFEAVKYAPPQMLPDGGIWIHPMYAEAVRKLPALEYWLDQNIGR